MIIHISGFPGSGKSKLGKKIKKIFGSKVIVYDTDQFIQHNNINGKRLLKIEKQIKSGEKKEKDYNILWKNIIKSCINDLVEKYPNKQIIFVGSLDNFSLKGEIYKINAKLKFILNIELSEILKRYYLRISEIDNNLTKKESEKYWKKVSKGIFNISSSNLMIKDYEKYMKWHKKNKYILLSENEIIRELKKIF